MQRRTRLQVFIMSLSIRMSNRLWTFLHPCDACGKRIFFAKSQNGAYDPDWIHTKCVERYCIQEGLGDSLGVRPVEPYYYEDPKDISE